MTRRTPVILQFNALFPGVDPTTATAEQWAQLSQLAYRRRNETVDVRQHHDSHYWAKVGFSAHLREQAARNLAKELATDACEHP